MPTDYEVVSISHAEPELINAAKAKAREKRMSFSAYVVSLIEADLRKNTPDRVLPSVKSRAASDPQSVKGGPVEPGKAKVSTRLLRKST